MRKAIKCIEQASLFYDYMTDNVYCAEPSNPIYVEFGYTPVKLTDILVWMESRNVEVTNDSVLTTYKHLAGLKRNYQGLIENACDLLHYGWNFRKFYSQVKNYILKADAMYLWNIAFEKMAN